MTRALALMFAATFALSACTAGGPIGTGTTPPGADVYRLSSISKSRVQFRMLDAVNVLRQNAGLAELELNGRLNAAAETHARDMHVQNRPWHFGSDGSSPVDRAQRAGYAGQLLGENISETFETELQTLAAWMEEASTRDVILNPSAREMGFAWFQESGGKIWWTLVTGSGVQPSEELQG
jgi:uncharacterized protein YkwD